MPHSMSAKRSRRNAWTTHRLWSALLCKDKKALASRLGCSATNVYSLAQRFRSTSPGGSGLRHFSDREIHRQMSKMLDDARHEALAAVAFVSPQPPAVFEHILRAAQRGVDVRLIFRSDK